MRYLFSYSYPQRHVIDLECVLTATAKQKSLIVQLPSWRPGRYELGNFAKNIQKWEVFDAAGNKLKSKKRTKDSWEIECAENQQIHIKYSYYAAELKAGSCYLDENQLYVNPVNCCIYMPDRIAESCELELHLPENYKVATALKPTGKNTFRAADFHELADSPFIASAGLQQNKTIVNDIPFYIHFQGDCKPDWNRIQHDFSALIKEQVSTMGSFTGKDYHFLFQFLPQRIYHGVEHLHSTVIALGPAYNFSERSLYNDFLGVSCHELYHSWNIKSIRPAEMMPYDYTRENYSRLGYVCEGVTTYYGDYFLLRSGVYSQQDYFKTFDTRLQKHFHNPARFTMPVTEASFDSWLDGYVSGIPARKTSIYDEGCLISFMTDILIRRSSADKRSLDDVMRALYENFAQKGKGYSEQEYIQLVEEIAAIPMTSFFENYVYGTCDYEPLLQELLFYIGCELIKTKAKKYHEAHFGFKLHETGPAGKVSLIYPDSAAEKAGLSLNDEIIAINGRQLKNDFNEWERYFADQVLELSVFSDNFLKKISLAPSSGELYLNYSIQKKEAATPAQKTAWKNWARQDF